MIETASDFEKAITELTNDREALSQVYSETMSSKDHNKIFKDIESELNAMYEHLRVLEDIKDYCRTSIMKAIEEEKVKLMDKLRIIEQASDSFSDTSCVAYAVSLESAPDVEIRDRNGDILPAMRNIDGQLEIDGLDSRHAAVATVKCTATGQCYSNSAQNLVSDNASRSLYVLKEPVNGGVTESYEITFKEPVRCNYVSIQTANWTAENLEVMLNTQGSTTILDTTNGYVGEAKIYGLSFSVRATNYEYRKVAIDKKNGTSSFALLDDECYKRRNTSKTVESFVAGTDKKNCQRYINDFIANTVKAERSSGS